uniref:BZIP domain-containing protein n=1 Tax=Leersia perrieri TaxID=77586 RepID=A0A0D9VBU6_9ORYZ
MASSSGSGGALSPPASATATADQDELRAVMEQRRAKRMQSNRESARRSRMRKQRHLDELTAQVSQLRRENAQLATALGVTAQGLLAVDADNAVLRTQAAELAARLRSLDDILSCISNTTAAAAAITVAGDHLIGFDAASAAAGFDDLFRSSSEMYQLC